MPDTARFWLPAALIALGLSVGGLMAGKGVTEARLGDRFVTVKGVAEREVEADLAVWTLQFSAGGNDLAAVQQTVARTSDASWAPVWCWSRARNGGLGVPPTFSAGSTT